MGWGGGGVGATTVMMVVVGSVVDAVMMRGARGEGTQS